MREQGDVEMIGPEVQFLKYLDRMFDITQCTNHQKLTNLSDDAIFKELNKVIDVQIEMRENQETMDLIDDLKKLDAPFKDSDLHVMTGIPIIDIIINIDWFTAHFDDRKKVLRILKELFNQCSSFKKLLLKHHFLVMTVLLSKYDKPCHLYQNRALMIKTGKEVDAELENRDEFLADIIGQLIRLFTKSKTLS